MKNNLKIFLAILITAIICISGTVCALNAYDTSYNPANNNWNVSTVGDALDSLYLNSKKVPELVYENSPDGSGSFNFTNLEINLEKNYKYLIAVLSNSWKSGTDYSTMNSTDYINIEAPGVVKIGKNYAYRGSTGSSHLTNVYLIPVTGNSVVLTKVTAYSMSIYGI